MKFKALFLDRDGVINQDLKYVHEQKNFHFIPGIFDVARHAFKQDYKIIIITNQAGIGRGYYTESDFHRLTKWMCEKFLEAGAPITHVYFSPYHPTEGIGEYLKDDYSRKPHPEMILRAKTDYAIDPGSSVLIGNSLGDIEAGEAAGVGKNLFFSKNIPPDLHKYKCELIDELCDAIAFLNS